MESRCHYGVPRSTYSEIDRWFEESFPDRWPPKDDDVSAEVLICIRKLRSDSVSDQRSAMAELRCLEWETFFALPDLIRSLSAPINRDLAALCIGDILVKESCADLSDGRLWPQFARFGRKKVAHKAYMRCIVELKRGLRSEDACTRRRSVEVTRKFLEFRTIWYPNQLHDPLVRVLCQLGLEGPADCVPDVVSSLYGAPDTRRKLIRFMGHSEDVVNAEKSGQLTRPLSLLLTKSGLDPYATTKRCAWRSARFFALLKCLDDCGSLLRQSTISDCGVWFEDAYSKECTPRQADYLIRASAVFAPEIAEELLLRRLQVSDRIRTVDILALASLRQPAAFRYRLPFGLRKRLSSILINTGCSGAATTHKCKHNIAAAELVAPTLSNLLRPTSFAVLEHRATAGVRTSKWFDQIRAQFNSDSFELAEAAEYFVTRVLIADSQSALDRTIETLEHDAKVLKAKLIAIAELAWRNFYGRSPYDIEAEWAAVCAWYMVFTSEERISTFRTRARRWHSAHQLFHRLGFQAYVKDMLEHSDFRLPALVDDEVLKEFTSRSNRHRVAALDSDLRSKTIRRSEAVENARYEMRLPDISESTFDIAEDLQILVDKRNRRLFEMIDSLDEKERTLIDSYYFGGMTVEEAGKMVGISKGQASKDIKKARGKLSEDKELKDLFRLLSS